MDKEFCFRSSSSLSIFSAQSVTSQRGNMINSTPRFSLNSLFANHSNKGKNPMLNVYQPQMESFGFNHNFIPNNYSPKYQIQNNAPLFEYSLLLGHQTPLGLNNSLVNDPPCNNLSNVNLPDDHRSVLLLLSLPVGNANFLIGGNENNNTAHDDGNTKKKQKKSSTKKSTCKSGTEGINIEKPTGRRRTGYKRKSKNTFNDKSSMYRGVSRYTGRFEAFLWDNTNPLVKGRTVYVGGFEREEDAARAYDLAALKFWGRSAPLNFPIDDYEKELAAMQYVSREEFLLRIRRTSKGFAKGVSNYRGVSRNSNGKKWQARLGKGSGTKGLYLGTFKTEAEAARAYDVGVLKMKGLHAITNFDLNHYDIRHILESSRLPIGKGASKRLRKNSFEEVLKLSKKNIDKNFPAPEHQVLDTATSSRHDHDHDHRDDHDRDHRDDHTGTSNDHQDNVQSNALAPMPTADLSQNPNSNLGDYSSTGGTSAAGLESDPAGDGKSVVDGTTNLELDEDLQFFTGDQFFLRQNPSFLNLFAAVSGSSCDSNGVELEDLTMTEAAGGGGGGGAASTDISWSELQQIETQEFPDFHDFFSHENDADFENPSLLDGFNGSAEGGLEQWSVSEQLEKLV